MTEARISSSGGKGLFATQAFSKGSLILEESCPAIKLSPISDEESQEICLKWIGDKKPASSPSKSAASTKGSSTLWENIVPPSTIPNKSKGTFRGMVQAGICWIQREASLSEADKTSILELYFPTAESASKLEEETISLAKEAVNYMKELLHDADKEFNDWSTLQNICLIWACNSFEGGRVYLQISRVNHSCNPNAIIQADGDTQRLVAACDIAVGDEISISYLGLLLYAETPARKEKLKTTKYFECHCHRCSSSSEEDMASCIPCPTCHPRELPQQSLEEDVQYDDDQTVKYVTLGETSKCESCDANPSKNKKMQVVMKNVVTKVATYLDSVDSASRIKGKAKHNDQDDDDDDEDTVLEEHLGLASSIMGDRHWTTNLLRLIHLDKRLSLMSQAMLTMQELPDMGDVAEAIDSLQRLDRFVQLLHLNLDIGHVLGDAVIGVARTLVSLGDVKSQKYGAEWLERISDYVDKFESEGRQKVVAALKVAWTKSKGASETSSGRAKKKLKSS